MAGDMDIHAHEATYTGVMRMLKWGTLFVIAVTALVVWLIAS